MLHSKYDRIVISSPKVFAYDTIAEEVDQRAAEEQASLDYALALQLQQQEESNAAAWHAHQQQEQQQPQPPPPPLHLQRGSDCPTGQPSSHCTLALKAVCRSASHEQVHLQMARTLCSRIGHSCD